MGRKEEMNMKKILVIDDELAYVKLLSDKLKAAHEVFSAHDGKKGLEIAEKEKPDLVLLDISMPVMDGLEMLKQLRESSFGKHMKVIMLTNLEPTEDIIKKAAADQPSSYVIKSDTSLEDLVKKVNGLLT